MPSEVGRLHVQYYWLKTSSGKLRSANTAAIHKVIWPHEDVYTPKGQPSEYEIMSSMAFVTGYMTILDLQSDPIRNHMWAHLRDLMHDGECFGWPIVRNCHAVWLQHNYRAWQSHLER